MQRHRASTPPALRTMTPPRSTGTSSVYIMVFVALHGADDRHGGVSYLHLSVHLAIAVALLVATIKGSLVACYFMHLISERKLIYFVLALTVFCSPCCWRCRS